MCEFVWNFFLNMEGAVVSKQWTPKAPSVWVWCWCNSWCGASVLDSLHIKPTHAHWHKRVHMCRIMLFKNKTDTDRQCRAINASVSSHLHPRHHSLLRGGKKLRSMYETRGRNKTHRAEIEIARIRLVIDVKKTRKHGWIDPFRLITSWSLAQATPFVRSGSNLFRNCQRGRGGEEDQTASAWMCMCAQQIVVWGLISELLVKPCTVPPNCNTLGKHHANKGRRKLAMEMWCKMRKSHWGGTVTSVRAHVSNGLR